MILSINALGSEYRGVPYMYQDYESSYLARIHEVLDGHPGLGSPFLAEGKNAPTPLLPFGEYMYALPVLLTPLSLVHVQEASKFLLPALLFLLIYTLAYLLAREQKMRTPRLVGVAAASLSVLGYDLVDPRALLELFHAPTGLYLSIWARLVNPICGALFLFVFLIALWHTIKGKPRYWILAGLCLALSVSYVFSFGICLATITSYIALSHFAKERPNRRLYWIIAGGLLLVGIFALPYIVHHAGTSSPLKNGLLLTHRPLLNKFLIFSLVVWVIDAYIRRTRLQSADLFLGAMGIGSLMAMNAQVIIGRTIWPQHFVQYTIPISIIIIVIALGRLGSRWHKAPVCVLVALAALSYLYPLHELPSYKFTLGDFRNNQQYAGLFSWLNDSAQPDCTVLAREDVEFLASYVPALTRCNTYYTTYVFVGVSDERILHNYFAHMRLDGVTPQTIHAYLDAHPTEVQANFFNDWKEIFRHTANAWLAAISDRTAIDGRFTTLNDNLTVQYADFYQKDFYQELKAYRLDYIIIDKRVNSAPFTLPHTVRVYSDNTVDVYAVS